MAESAKNFDSPDEVREFEGKGQVDIVNIGERAVGRGTFEPGWKWSNNVKPIAKTDSCQTDHLVYILEGRMKVFMDDGSELEFGPGDVGRIPPGHDAEVVGDDTVVSLELGDAGNYAKPA